MNALRHLSIAGAALLVVVAFGGAVPTQAQERAEQEGKPEVFMWLGGNHVLSEYPQLVDNQLAFAARHGIIPYEAGAGQPELLETFLRRAKEAGIERTWIEIRPRQEETGGATAEDFATDPERRAATLERFRRLARIYKRYYPNFARVTIFDEAPIGAFAMPKKEALPGGVNPYTRSVALLAEHGPQAFAYMKDAIQDVMPQAEVGIFLHHPHNAPPEEAGEHSFIAAFMEKAAALGAAPDFIYSDLYRGYFARGYGQARTDRYIEALVRHTREVGRRYGAETYHLGQAHTIKLGYTPSRRELDTNVRATLSGGADGLGWYWPNYAATDAVRTQPGTIGPPAGYDVSFDPFIPNSWGKVGPAGTLYGTSRDRFSYAYLRALEAASRLDAEERFDLWIYGHDFDHAEHRLSIKAPGDSEWTFVGHFNPQRDADGYLEGARAKYRYSYDEKWHAVVFHGLHRSRFLGDTEAGGSVQVKIETPEAQQAGDGSRLTAVYAMPYRRTRNYATEAEVTRLIETHPRWTALESLARHVRPVPQVLRPGQPFTFTLEGDRPAPRTTAQQGTASSEGSAK